MARRPPWIGSSRPGSPRAPPASSSARSRASSSSSARAPTARCSSPARCSSRWPRASSCARRRCGADAAGSPTPRGGAPPFSSWAPCSSTSAPSTPCRTGSRHKQQNRLVWAPDLFGSGCFLVSGALAYARHDRAAAAPGARDREWRMAAVNLAGLRVLRGLGGGVVRRAVDRVGPRPGAPRTGATALGALCFFIGALLLWPRQPERTLHDSLRRLQGGMTMSTRRRPELAEAGRLEPPRRARGLARSTATASCSSRRPTTSCPSTACARSTRCG